MYRPKQYSLYDKDSSLKFGRPSINFSKYECLEGDMNADLFQSEYEKCLEDLNLSEEQIESLQKATIGQHENELWVKERKKRLTASAFGNILKMTEASDRCTLAKRLISPSPPYINFSKPINYGRENENMAIAAYEQSTKQSVAQCGLFVHWEFGYLGASPDGLVGRHGIVEVKCPYSAREMSPLDSAKRNPDFCCTIMGDGKMKLRSDHKYYYQIQGQLAITDRDFCDFVVWTPRGKHIERIYRDKKLWEDMFPKLEAFYKLYMLPEIVDPRIKRGLPMRVLEFVERGRWW